MESEGSTWARDTALEDLLDEDGYAEEEEEEMKITFEVDGKIVWEGECEDGCQISRWADENPKYVKSHQVEDYEAVILDLGAADVLIGVELLSHPKGFGFRDAIAQAPKGKAPLRGPVIPCRLVETTNTHYQF